MPPNLCRMLAAEKLQPPGDIVYQMRPQLHLAQTPNRISFRGSCILSSVPMSTFFDRPWCKSGSDDTPLPFFRNGRAKRQTPFAGAAHDAYQRAEVLSRLLHEVAVTSSQGSRVFRQCFLPCIRPLSQSDLAVPAAC